MGMWIRLYALFAIGTAVVLLAYPNLSFAGTYEVGACTETVGYVNHSWVLYNNTSTSIEANSACDQAPTHQLSATISNLAVADILGAGDPPVGVEAGWRFTAPPSATIVEARGSDDLFKDTDNSWEIYLKDAGGNVLGGQTCLVNLKNNFYCEVSGVFQVPGINTSSLAIGILCTENSFHNCPGGATIHEVRAELDYATVTIKDEVAPSGVIGSRIPAGPQSGMISLFGSAEDITAGLLSLSVVDGAGEVVGGPVTPGTCNYSFTTPCPTKAENVAIPIDTTKLPNGQDQIRVEATNAAHDEGFSTPYTIDVENSSPMQGGGGNRGPGGGSKTGGSGGSNTQTGGSGTSSGQGPPMGPTTSTGSSLTTTPTPVSIHLDKLKRTATNLLISGRLDPAVAGIVTVTIWHTGSRGTVIRNLHLHVTDGHFRVRIALARRLRRRHLTISASYPGGIGYLRASITRVVDPANLLPR